jgi:DNA-binding transcriptional ArsR family regulator
VSDAAELFEAISHPTRIRISRLLEKEPFSFASLKRRLNIDSSGNLDHHLKKLGPLIRVQNDGLYALTDAGKEALLSIGTIEVSKMKKKHYFHSFAEIPKSIVALIIFEGLMGVLSFLAFLPLHGPVVIQYYLLNAYFYTFVMSWLSVAGLLRAKEWAWTLIIVQSVLLVVAGFQIAMGFGSLIVVYASSNMFGALRYVLAVLGIVSLMLALLPSVREVLGTKYVTALPRRALISGILGMASVVFNFCVGELLIHGRGGGTGILGALMFMAALPIVVGALLVLLRKFLAGGLVLIITSCTAFYNYFIIGAAILSILGLSSEYGIMFGLLIFAMPLVAGILSLTSRPKIVN